MYTPARVSGGKVMPGVKKMTTWVKEGEEGMENAY